MSINQSLFINQKFQLTSQLLLHMCKTSIIM